MKKQTIGGQWHHLHPVSHHSISHRPEALRDA